MSASSESLHAFDRHSAGYSSAWGDRPLVRRFRARVLAACARHFSPGGRILDLGCGPGLDAAVLEGMGFDVTAIDASSGMVGEASRRTRRALHLPMERVDRLAPEQFDGALSNFGALNCVADLGTFGVALADRLRPGARVILVYMGPRCLAEDLALLARGRRPRRRDGPVPLEGLTVEVRYLTARAVSDALPGFRPLHREALGALVAPPDLGGRVGLRSRAEPYIAGLPGLRDLGDHQMLVLERR